MAKKDKEKKKERETAKKEVRQSAAKAAAEGLSEHILSGNALREKKKTSAAAPDPTFGTGTVRVKASKDGTKAELDMPKKAVSSWVKSDAAKRMSSSAETFEKERQRQRAQTDQNKRLRQRVSSAAASAAKEDADRLLKTSFKDRMKGTQARRVPDPTFGTDMFSDKISGKGIKNYVRGTEEREQRRKIANSWENEKKNLEAMKSGKLPDTEIKIPGVKTMLPRYMGERVGKEAFDIIDKYATDDERRALRKVLETKGQNEYGKALRAALPEIGARGTREESRINYDYGREHPFLASAASVPANMEAGVQASLDNTGQQLKKQLTMIGKTLGTKKMKEYFEAKEKDENATADALMEGSLSTDRRGADVYTQAFQRLRNVQAMREGAGSHFGDFKIVYDVGMSVLDSVLATAVAGPGATGILAANAAASGMISAAERGASDDQIIATGVAQGVAEGLFEKLSIDHFIKTKNAPGLFNAAKLALSGNKRGAAKIAKTAGLNILKQSAIEGSEEAFTEVANILTDAAIMDGSSETQLRIREYVQSGMSEKEARKKAYIDNVGQVALSAAGGALSGALMGGFGAAIGNGDAAPYTNESLAGQESFYRSAGERGASFENASAADSMQALSPAERESAYRSGQQAFAQSVTDTIKKDPGEGGVRLALLRSGFTGADDAVLARDIIDFARGKKLTDGQRRRMSTNDSVMRVTEAIAASPETMEAIRNRYAEAQSRAETVRGENKTGEKYKIDYTTDNRPVVVVENDFLKGVDPKDYARETKKILSGFKPGIPVKGRFVTVSRQSATEYTHSKYSKRLLEESFDTYADKMRLAKNIDEVINASTDYVNEPKKHSRTDDIKEFARGNVLFEAGENQYSADVLIAQTKDGGMKLYDVLNIEKANFKNKKKNSSKTGSAQESALPNRPELSFNDSISQENANVNGENLTNEGGSQRLDPRTPIEEIRRTMGEDAAMTELFRRESGLFQTAGRNGDDFETLFSQAPLRMVDRRAAETAYRAGIKDRFYAAGENGESFESVRGFAPERMQAAAAEAYQKGLDSRARNAEQIYSGETREGGGYGRPDASGKQPGLVWNEEAQQLTPQERKNIAALARKLGKRVYIQTGLVTDDGRPALGKINDAAIYADPSRGTLVQDIIVHEFSHRMKQLSPDSWQKYAEYAINDLKKTGRYDGIYSEFTKHYDGMAESEIHEEMAADYAYKMFDSEESLTELIRQDKPLAEKIKDVWFALLEKLGRDVTLKRAKNMWKMCLTEAGKTAERGGNQSGTKYMLNPNFNKAVDNWNDNLERRTGMSLLVGETSEPLMSIGVKKQKIYWDTTKINKTLNDHPDLDIDVIKSVPYLLENPVLIMQSKNPGYRQGNNRISLYGDLYNRNGIPVVAILELEPNAKNVVLDEIKIASTHARTDPKDPKSMKPTAEFIKNHTIKYVDPDKKRTAGWLARTERYRPFLPADSGSIGTIAYKHGVVKGEDSSNQGKNMLPFEGGARKIDRDTEKLVVVKGETEKAAAEISKQFGTNAAKTEESIGRLYSYIVDKASTRSAARRAAVKEAKLLTDMPMKAAENIDGAAITETINKYSGETIETLWNALTEKFPDVFGKESETVAERLARISDVKKQIERGEAVTAVDRAQYNERVNALADEMLKNFETADIRKYDLRKENEMLEYELSKAEGEAERFRVSRDRERLQPQIDRNYSFLKSKLLNPKGESYVPEHMRASVAKFLSLFSDEVVRTPWDLKNPEKMSAVEVKKAQLYDSYCAIMRERLGEEYNAANELHRAVFDESLAEELRTLKENVPTDENGNFVKLSKMKPQELVTVGKMLAGVNHAIVSENKLFRDGIRKTVSELGESVIAEAGKHKDERRAKNKKADGERHSPGEGKGAAGKVLDVIGDEWSFNELRPYDLFERLGGTMKRLYKELRKSQNEFTWKRRDMIEMMKSATENLDTDKITGKNAEVLTFETESGESLKMTRGQVMSLYALNLRETARKHILGGGVTIGNADLKSNERLNRSGTVKLTESDVEKITSVLEKEEIDSINKVVGYMTGPCAKMANEVSMKLYGYEKYGEKWYFPIKVSRDALATYSGEYGEGNIRTQSFTKRTSGKAVNPIEINDFFETAIGHIDGVSLYSTMALPMLDMERVMNYKHYDENGAEKIYKTNVRSELKSAYGAGAVNYINKLFEDLNGQTKVQGDKIGDALMALQKKAAIGLNIRVLLQQPTAMVRAMYYIPDLRDWLPENPVSMVKDHGKSKKEMLEHSAIAYWKSLGFYEIGIGRNIYDIAMGKESRYDQIAMGAYGKADDMTWTAIWNATKRKIKRENPGIDTKSAEFMQTVSDEFDRIIDASQVVDTPLHRTQSMRSKNAFTKAETAFMSEPLTTLNMMRTEMVIAQRNGGTKKAVKTAARLAGVYAASALAQALAQSVPDLWRDKDEDNWYTADGKKISTWKKWFAELADDFVGNMNPISMIPYAKSLLSFATSYGQKSMEWQGIRNLITASKRLTNDKLPISARMINFAGSLAAVGGLSINTAFKDLQGIGELAFRQISDGEYGSYMLKKWEWNIEKPENREKFFKYYTMAVKNGHVKDAELILADYTYNLKKGKKGTSAHFVPPAKGSKESTVLKAMSNLYKSTGEDDIFFNLPGQRIDVNGKARQLNESDYKEYAAKTNDRLMELAYELVTSDFYKGGKNEANTMTDEEKVAAFKTVKSYARKSVKKDIYKGTELSDREKDIYSGKSTLADYVKEQILDKRRKPVGEKLHEAYLSGSDSYAELQDKYEKKGYSAEWIGDAEEYAAKSSKTYKKELEQTKNRLLKAAEGLSPEESEYAKAQATAAAAYYTKKKHIAGYDPQSGIVPSYTERAEPYGISIEDYIRYKAGARTAAEADGNDSLKKTELWDFINSTTTDPDLRIRMYLVLKNKSWK